jgi:hypothetical protein
MIAANLVVGGAPKCGTSSLYKYLDDHPDVCGSDIKETAFLVDKNYPFREQLMPTDIPRYHDTGLEGYAAFFTRCKAESAKFLMEASSGYLYQQTALDVLTSMDPAPKIVFILRKPSAKLWSHYRFSQDNYVRLPADFSFAEFIRLSKDTKDELGKLSGNPTLQHAYEYTKYVNYLKLYKQKAKPGQVCVYLFEDMKNNPRQFMQKLAKDVGLDASFYDTYDFAVYNETVSIKNRALHKALITIKKVFPKFPFSKNPQVRKLYNRFNSKPATRKPNEVDKATMTLIDQEFEPYNQELAREFNLDLTSWKQEREPKESAKSAIEAAADRD